MVVDQPGVLVQAHHAHVGHDAPLGLVDEVARDGRVLGVQFPVGLLDFLLVGLDESVFFRVDETGFEKEVPEGIQLDACIDIGILVLGPLQQTE